MCLIVKPVDQMSSSFAFGHFREAAHVANFGSRDPVACPICKACVLVELPSGND